MVILLYIMDYLEYEVLRKISDYEALRTEDRSYYALASREALGYHYYTSITFKFHFYN